MTYELIIDNVTVSSSCDRFWITADALTFHRLYRRGVAILVSYLDGVIVYAEELTP